MQNGGKELNWIYIGADLGVGHLHFLNPNFCGRNCPRQHDFNARTCNNTCMCFIKTPGADCFVLCEPRAYGEIPLAIVYKSLNSVKIGSYIVSLLF